MKRYKKRYNEAIALLDEAVSNFTRAMKVIEQQEQEIREKNGALETWDLNLQEKNQDISILQHMLKEADDNYRILDERFRKKMSSAQKKGRWVKVSGYATPGGDPVWACSECGKGLHTYGIEHGSYGSDIADRQWVSCPNCGADMREGREASE